MAKISLNNSEIINTLQLIEQIFPGVSLSPINVVLKDLSLSGSHIILAKTIAANNILTLEIDVN